jgi:transcriptional regulator with XRE-family HTH domain
MEEWKLRLKEARERAGLNKTEFAKMAKVSNATVTDWEKAAEDGGIREISGIRLSQICKVLDVTPDWLLYGTDSSAAKKSEPPDTLSEGEAELLLVYRAAVDADKTFLLGVADAIRRRMIVEGTWDGPKLAARA